MPCNSVPQSVGIQGLGPMEMMTKKTEILGGGGVISMVETSQLPTAGKADKGEGAG